MSRIIWKEQRKLIRVASLGLEKGREFIYYFIKQFLN